MLVQHEGPRVDMVPAKQACHWCTLAKRKEPSWPTSTNVVCLCAHTEANSSLEDHQSWASTEIDPLHLTYTRSSLLI